MTFRIERKLNLNTLNVFSLSDIFHRQGFKKIYPDRWVNSIYFEDQMDTSILDNLSGINNRAKIRLRWYGNIQLDQVLKLIFQSKTLQ